MSKSTIALLGWSLPAIEAAQKLDRNYVVVSYPAFEDYASENDIPFVPWDFDSLNEVHNGLELAEKLEEEGASVAVPLFEETVEWAGAVNAQLRQDPRLLNRAYLVRNKVVMKRKALLGGLRVGLFEEVDSYEEIYKFLKRLNEANLQLEGEEDAWIHLKPFSAAGTIGHKLLRSRDDITAKVTPQDFPCLIESHLPGKEFSCEVFVHEGKIRFLNITEYVHLGYSNFIPCSPELREKWDKIYEANQRLVDTFGIEYGVLHPEWFLTEDDDLSFGEVATRVPGGHIFELIENAWGVNAYQAFFLCSDPATTEEELNQFFPDHQELPGQYASSLMVYPKQGHITKLNIPAELTEDDYFESHTLPELTQAQKISGDREGFGNHYGTIFFKGEDPKRMKELLRHYEDVSFYV